MATVASAPEFSVAREPRLLLLVKQSLSVLESAAEKRFWSVGFSGGKDSSVLLDLVVRFLLARCSGAGSCPERVVVVYSDTLLEPPPLRNYALAVIESVNGLARSLGLSLVAVAAAPDETGEDLVEMVIGRGYPAPSSRFRWCTDRWKIRPTRTALRRVIGRWRPGELAVVSGVRAEEAIHRRRVGNGGCVCPIMQSDDVGGAAYAPLYAWSASDVWAYIGSRPPIWQQPDWGTLRELYDSSVAELRMGCWSCTLVTKDRGWKNLVEKGLVEKEAYEPLDMWRQVWLHMSRVRPDLWRTVKNVLVTKKGRSWRYRYSKLRPEARYLLARLLVDAASGPARPLLGSLAAKAESYVSKLSIYRESTLKLLETDDVLQRMLLERGFKL